MRAADGAGRTERITGGLRPRINLRPLLFCAAGMLCGVTVYFRARLGGLSPVDFLFPALLLFFGLVPFDLRRVCVVLACFFAAGGLGAGLAHLHTERYLSGKPTYAYTVTGTVEAVSDGVGYDVAVVGSLSFDGERTDGRLLLNVSSPVVAGDLVLLISEVEHMELPDADYAYYFANDIRYRANEAHVAVTGKSGDPFLRLNAAVHDVLFANASQDVASVCYALLTGNSEGMDEGLAESFRRGGIAHIFAVSGLHIGILFAAVQFLFRKTGKYAVLPAFLVSLLYSAVCGFTVSSLRAVIMSTAAGIWFALGRKTDFLSSVSFAAIAVLILFPAQWLSVGFRLSFGACVGLALFSGSFSRAFRRLPSFFGKYLAANLSVQLFTFPILLDAFGFFPLWGVPVNLVLVPFLPTLFLILLACTLLALIIPPAAGALLAAPTAVVTLLVVLFSLIDFLVISGFSLGAGSVVWSVGAVGLSERVRLSRMARLGFAVVAALLFAFFLIYRNLVFYGCRISVDRRGGLALVRTRSAAVLVLDDGVTLGRCEDFLARNYGGRLDAVVATGENEYAALNVAAFVGADTVYVYEEIDAGFQKTDIVAAERFEIDGMQFRFESETKLSVAVEREVVEIDFTYPCAFGTLYIGEGAEGGQYFLHDGRIYALG